MFSTSFSYHVIGSLKLLQRQLREYKDDWGCKFDKLLGYTHNINEYDVWMHDHETGWDGHRYVAALARLWKEVLQKSDAQLRIDSEFTRPAVLYMLQKFKEKVEDIDKEYDDMPKVKFNFRASRGLEIVEAVG